jgi:hypothetical protein
MSYITDVTNSPTKPPFPSPEKHRADSTGVSSAAKRALFSENSQADHSDACKTRKWTDESEQETLAIFDTMVPTDFSGWAQVNYRDGTSYLGDFVNGMRHGIGTLSLKDRICIANWNEDVIHGVAEIRFNNGFRFIGRWNNGVRYDSGVSIYPDHSQYAGEFKNWMRHGQGEVVYSDGNSYKGWWKNDKQHGSGVIKYADGSVILGNFVEGQMHGKVTRFSPNMPSVTVHYDNGKLIPKST